MLSPEYLREMPNEILEMYGKLEEDIISDISRRITKDLELTATADYQISVLQEMGYDLKDINKEIQKTTNIASGKFEEIILDSSYINYENEKAMYGVGGKILKPMQPYMKQYIKSTIKQGQKDLRNITNTLGFVDKKNNFKKIDMFYKDTLNNATMKLGSGAFSYDAVVRDAVKTMADSGVRTIDYKSGRKYHIESAVRMTVRTASSQISSRISEDNAEMMGQDLMEVTAHGGARPSHAEWQGQIVSRSGENKQYLSADDIGHETVSGFKGVNCRHDWSPFFEGLSVRAYTDKELEELDNADFEYEGKEYNHYEATQKQRHIERQMSESKRKLIAYDKAGLKDDFTAESIKLKRQRQEYERFSKVAGIRPKHERHGVYGYDRSISAKSSWANRKAQELDRVKSIKKVDMPNVKGLKKPIRPTRPREENFKDGWLDSGFIKAREKYEAEYALFKENNNKYKAGIKETIEANLNRPREYNTVEDFKKWADEKGFTINVENIKKIDTRAIDDYINVTDNLMEKYPIVKERYKKLEYRIDYIDWDSGGQFMAEASQGFKFGDSFKDYELVQQHLLEVMTSGQIVSEKGTVFAGEMIMGNGTIDNLYTHEFGHQLHHAIKEKHFGVWSPERDARPSVAWDKELVDTVYGKKGISTYASTNHSELFAEAFAEYETAGETTEFGKAMGKFLRKWL